MKLRPKRRWSIVPVAGVVGLTVTAAFAFFLTTYLADGSHEGKTGKASTETLPMLISFPEEQLTPEHPVDITAKVENTSGKAQTFQKFHLSAETPTVPRCGNEWLVFRGEGSYMKNEYWEEVVDGTNDFSLSVASGTSDVITGGGENGPHIWLEFDPNKTNVDQSSCEGVPVIVSGHLE